MGTRLTRRTTAARLAGVFAAVATVIVLWFVALPLFVSWAGLMIAAVIAFGTGTVTATLIDSQWERNAGVVTFTLLVLAAFYVLVLTRLPPYENLHRSEGGPAVLPPR